MANNSTGRETVSRLTGIAILSALIIVLQSLSNFVSFGPVSITLALTPIIIGGAIYGCTVGAMLGFVFGCIVLVSGLLGWDKGFVLMLLGESPFYCIAGIFVKCIAAGYLGSLCYRFLERKSTLAGVIASGFVTPLVNTGLFVVVMVLCYADLLKQWSGGTDIVKYAVTAFIGVNFLVELTVNLILSSGITRIIRTVKK